MPMPDTSFLKAAPYHLDNEALEWVNHTFDRLDQDGRIAQLFCFRSHGNDAQEHDHLMHYQPGGIIRIYGSDSDVERTSIDRLQSEANVPMLIAADLEGSRMSLTYGTQVPNPLSLAAIDSTQVTADISTIMAKEGLDVGVNWSYTPLLDINLSLIHI